MTTAQPSERSKTGCWTCRLRKKKCNEGGPPCSNCESRGVLCHGYGPRPEWKDRGKLEKEQASMIRLQSRTRQGRHKRRENSLSQHSSTSSVSRGDQSPNLQSATQAEGGPLMTPLSSPQVENPSLHGNWDEFDFSNDLWTTQNATESDEALAELSGLQPSNSWNIMDFSNDFWINQTSVESPEVIVNSSNLRHPTERPSSSVRDDSVPECPPTSSNLAGTLAKMNNSQSTVAVQPPNGILFPSLGSNRDRTEVKEREIELLMHFVGETFGLQHPSYRTASALQRSWLLCLLTRSPTFYHASLSMSAYHCFLTLSGDNSSRETVFQDYQKYRACALREFSELTRPESAAVLPHSFLGESMICGVQIALLEALGKNMQECQMHLSLAAQFFHQNRDLLSTNFTTATNVPASETGLGLDSPASSSALPVPRSSPMERTALDFFRALLLWNDILSCAVQTTVPKGVQAYRVLLTDEEFAESFRRIIGCESWILLTIIDATFLEIWKRDQDARGVLSIRELISRAEKIESVLESGIAKLSKSPPGEIPMAGIGSGLAYADGPSRVQTHIFAHSVLIHLHTIVSRPWPGVPEIQQSVDRSISAWKLSPSSLNLRTLAWPYCVGASLAVGSQREMFQKIILEAFQKEQTLGSHHHLESVVKECWRSLDSAQSSKVASCDWKEVMQRLNISILFL